jgi:hypothetical protein
LGFAFFIDDNWGNRNTFTLVWWGTPLTDPNSDPNFNWIFIDKENVTKKSGFIERFFKLR